MRYRVTLADEPTAVFVYVAEHGPATALDISNATGIPAVAYDLGLLQRLGFVKPAPDHWMLTDEGRRAFERAEVE